VKHNEDLSKSKCCKVIWEDFSKKLKTNDLEIVTVNGDYCGVGVYKRTGYPLTNGRVDMTKFDKIKQIYGLLNDGKDITFKSEAELIRAIEDNSANNFNEEKIVGLINELNTVHFDKFWHGSELLKRAKLSKDPRVTKALVMRHHYLQNKFDDSCILLRHTILTIEEPAFNTLWSMLESDVFNESTAASFVLGDIGGLPALKKLLTTLGTFDAKVYAYAIPCLVHLIYRYLKILDESEPTMQRINVETGETENVLLCQIAPDIYDRTMECRKISNKHFVAIPHSDFAKMIDTINKIPEHHFDDPRKEVVVGSLEYLQSRLF
jgi:hypothetical protein